MKDQNPKNEMTKNAILARRKESTVPQSVHWGIQVVGAQLDALRALPASASQAERKATMKRVSSSFKL
jgi:hypothetical protein